MISESIRPFVYAAEQPLAHFTPQETTFVVGMRPTVFICLKEVGLFLKKSSST